MRLGVVGYLSVASGAISGPLIARGLGPAGRGDVAITVVYFSIMTLLCSLGIPLAIGHAVGNRRLSASSALGCALRFCGLLVVPVLIATFLLLEGPLSHIHGGARTGAAILLACTPIAVLGQSLIYIFIAEGSLGPVTLSQAVQPTVSTLAVIFLFGSGLLTVGTYLGAFVIASVVTPLVALSLLGARPKGGSSLRPLLGFGIRGYAGTLASFVAVRADQALIGPLLGASQLGIYAVSVTIAALPSSLALAIAFRAFGDVAEAEPDARPAVIASFLRLGLLVSLILAAGVAIASPFLLTLVYGSDFADALLPLLILLPGSVALTLSGSAASSLTAVGRPGRVTLAELSGFVTSLLGLPFIIPRFGIVGAACLSTVAYTVTTTAYVRAFPELPLRALIPGRVEFRRLNDAVRSVAQSLLRRAAPGNVRTGSDPGDSGNDDKSA